MNRKFVCLFLSALLVMTTFVGCTDIQHSTVTTTEDITTTTTAVFADQQTGVADPITTKTKTHSSTTLGGETTTTASPTKSSSVSTAVTTKAPAPPTVHTLTPIGTASYYGLSKLKTMSNSAALVGTYEKLVQAVENCQTNLSLDQTLTEQEFVTVFYYYRADYPQHFWCDGEIGYSILQRTGKVTAAELHYTMTGDALGQARIAFNAAVTDFLKIAATGRDEYEREQLLHDALSKHITYADGKNAHNAYGALVEGKAVCEGYARAFQYLLYQTGIQCLIAEGSGINPSTGKREGHAWNVVRINGQYYHVDLTWDDPDNSKTPVMYPFFNVTTAQIMQDHSISTTDCYALPNCTATTANYHVKNGTRLTQYTVDGVAALLKDKTGGVHIYCVNGTDSFVQWFHNNHKRVTQAMGWNRGYSYTMLCAGNEVVLNIE